MPVSNQLEAASDACLEQVDVRPGEEVVLLADTDTDAVVSQAFFAAAERRQAQPTIVLMRTRSANGLEPTRAAAESLRNADVIFALTGASATHTTALKTAANNGARICSMPGISADILGHSVMTPDYAAMRRLAARLGEIFVPGRRMHVSTAAGTELQVDMGGWQRMPMIDDGTFVKGMIANLPAGEVLVAPWEGGQTSGRVVVDLAVSCYPEPLSEPIVVEFEGGRMVRTEGGEAARSIQRLIDANGPTAGHFAEMAIGINPNARNTGVLIETEKQFGTAHIGIGNSASIGGSVWAPTHIDIIFGRPTIAVDGRVILREGEFNEDVLKREDASGAEPIDGPLALGQGLSSVRDGKLHLVWSDVHGTQRTGQVGDDDTASRAIDVLESIRSNSTLGEQDRRVAAVMRLYGLVA
jgi:leucyl aminopeptidase (aminopeptidase T)